MNLEAQEEHNRQHPEEEKIYPEGTERTFDNQRIRIKLECGHEGCKETVGGIEGYNGSFTADDGDTADLRDQVYNCGNHNLK